MTKTLAIITYLIITFNCTAQISTDSLLTAINANYSITGHKDYLLESFTQFESHDKRDKYDVFLDSTLQLSEYIGLSVVHYGYDELGRIKIIEGFNSKGMRSYWDFPEVQIFSYVSDTVVAEMNQIKNEICQCQTEDTLSNVVIIEELNTDIKYNKIRFQITSKDTTAKLTYALCSNGKLCNRAENVAFIYREFDTINRSLITHERFYDSNLDLTEGKHLVYESENSGSSSNVAYAYTHREIVNGKIRSTMFYSTIGELIETTYSNDSHQMQILAAPGPVSKKSNKKNKTIAPTGIGNPKK